MVLRGTSNFKKIVSNINHIYDYVLNFYDVNLEDIFMTLPHWKQDGIIEHFKDKEDNCVCTAWVIRPLGIRLIKAVNSQTGDEIYNFEEIKE